MNALQPLLLTLGVVIAMTLIGVGLRALFQPGPKLRPWLMIAAGLVTLFNLWIYTLPVGTTAG